MRCGLLGRKLGHSYSPQIHRQLGEYTYELFEKEPDELEEFLKNGPFDAINVTIPYKKDVIPYCSQLSPVAKMLGAVNTIIRTSDGSLVGHNTDYYGFLSTVNRSGIDVAGKKVLVLGSGGASATACAVLETLGAKVIVISRSTENNYQNIDRHWDASLIVNTTPVGMYPNNGHSPVSLARFKKLEGVFDLIYNPAHTALLLEARERHLPTENGLWMLVAQAKESGEWFLGTTLPDALISQIHKTLSKEMQNIILVGMPGSGKTTIAKQLAHQTGKIYVDADAEIEAMAGMTIPQIFASEGENGFRQRETKVLEKLGKQSGYVISTGGGCVTKVENLPLLKQNGTIYWILRDLSLLPTDGRPLSQMNSLQEMYHIRKPMYERFSDHEIDNNGSIQDAVDRILKLEENA